jgi:adenosyl cobinamide kinase/adenosyl cobinamide phosphate guanylyltransferase
MVQRIAEHKKRRSDEWTTIEEADGIVLGATGAGRASRLRPGGLSDHLVE